MGRQPGAVIYGEDVLARPGDTVILSAILARDIPPYLGKRISGAVVNFFAGSERIGVSITDDVGIASIKFKLPDEQTEDILITCILNEADKYLADAGTIYLAVSEESAPVLITDIDLTIADITSFQFLITRNRNTPPMPGASEALTRLSEQYRIVYLTAREDILTNRTKEWLSMNGFPPGPLIARSMRNDRLAIKRYKTRKVSEIKSLFPNTQIGVGDKKSDCIAYLRSGLVAFFIGSSPEKAPKGAIAVENWTEIYEIIQSEYSDFRPQGAKNNNSDEWQSNMKNEQEKVDE